MADVARILRLVEQGILSPEEADQVLAALEGEQRSARVDSAAAYAAAPSASYGDAGSARHLRIQISEGGRQVVNLRVPINIAGLAASFVPGLPDEEAERIRAAIRSGLRGPLIDIGSDDGERVLIVSE